MMLALEQARKGAGRTSPNPAVGAIIIDRHGKVIAKGHHRCAGAPHAEIEALRQLPEQRAPKSATLYVTLEPCSTWGRTPPCTDAVIASGLKKIVVGTRDPNPAHAGRGIEILRESGAEVLEGVLAQESAHLNRAFNKWIVTGLPWVIAKAAMSLDGRITRPPNEPRTLSGPRSFRRAHELRNQVDAIMVGAETVRTDDPQLTVRGIRNPKQPWRIVISRSGNIPRTAKLLTDASADRTLLYVRKPLARVFRDLGEKYITSVLIEGGGSLIGSALDAGLIDEAWILLTPRLCGGPTVAVAGKSSSRVPWPLRSVSFERSGEDVLIRGLLH